MTSTVQVSLVPSGRQLEIRAGASLRDSLILLGVEFPCGGDGHCGGCRIRLVQGSVALRSTTRTHRDPDGDLPTAVRIEAPADLRACRLLVVEDSVIEVISWSDPDALYADDIMEPDVLAAAGRRPAIRKRRGPSSQTQRVVSTATLGAVVDVGTTTLVVQLVDLEDGVILASTSAANPQLGHGSDIITRLAASQDRETATRLRDLVRSAIGAMIDRCVAQLGASARQIARAVLVGNSVMHHIFCGIDTRPLAKQPFAAGGPQEDVSLDPVELGWSLASAADVRFLACVASFVGSDLTCGVLSTRLRHSARPALFVDLGTNSEIAVGCQGQVVCASTAAGPAFEGARLSCGMRAVPGAIDRVDGTSEGFAYRVIGDLPARGLCGSAVVDVLAIALDSGWLAPSGRLIRGDLEICPGVRMSQQDVREVQLAKAAIATALLGLQQWFGPDVERPGTLYLAGAFGNFLRLSSALRIGLVPFSGLRVVPVGNAALRGARQVLLDPGCTELGRLRDAMHHLELPARSEFVETYVEQMAFPGGSELRVR